MVEPELLVSAFAKYCGVCDGAMCCRSNVMTVFESELCLLRPFGIESCSVCEGWGAQRSCRNIDLNSGCRFLTDTGCLLPASVRPIDCLTYPFYPVAEGLPELRFLIAAGCPKSAEMAADKELIALVEAKWHDELSHLSRSEVADWLADNGEWKKELVEVKGR